MCFWAGTWVTQFGPLVLSVNSKVAKALQIRTHKFVFDSKGGRQAPILAMP